MKMTITNITNTAGSIYFPGFTINTPTVGGSGVSPDAVGGSITYPLPYPANKAGPLAAGASVVVTLHTEDFQNKSVPWLPLTPSTEWQMLVQKGIVTVAFSEGNIGKNVDDQAVATVA